MISTRIVFILGAGSSQPYGYPTGNELRSMICEDFIAHLDELLDEFYGDVRSHGKIHRMNSAKEFVKFYKNARGQSIDLFLARNNQFEDIGKISIVLNILLAEQKSNFAEDLEPKNREQDWYTYLFHRMTEELTSPEDYERFGENMVSFITFNYDRSNEELNEARILIRKAKRVFLLGFGYHNENLEVLGIPGVFKHEPKIYGTALGSTDKEIADIRSKLTVIDNVPLIEKDGSTAFIQKTLNPTLHIEKMNCRELLREYL